MQQFAPALTADEVFFLGVMTAQQCRAKAVSLREAADIFKRPHLQEKFRGLAAQWDRRADAIEAAPNARAPANLSVAEG